MTVHIKGTFDTGEVWVNGYKLDPSKSQEIINHSPDGFAWGYGGSGPSQLALSILLEFYPPDIAKTNYQQFKKDHIVTLPRTDFETTIEL